MRNLLAFLAAAALTILGAGYYLGWYSIVSTSGASGHRSVNIDINTSKIGHDIGEGAAKVQKFVEKEEKAAAEQAGSKSDKQDKAAPLTPGNNGQLALPPNPVDPATHKATTPVATDPHQFKLFEQ